jgi:hypothetical protein
MSLDKRGSVLLCTILLQVRSQFTQPRELHNNHYGGITTNAYESYNMWVLKFLHNI